MSVQTVRCYVARCDGCGRELGQGYGHRETYDTTREAQTAAKVAGWTVRPDGDMYCCNGDHQ
ncbi:hypothetical protein [Kitasatospora sp. NPDC057223]|uniref:hypothetical protein n=1 Tax=Kitasatospora sp. NPDC057223 TaxID=3346055 RepID=UPI0036322C3B